MHRNNNLKWVDQLLSRSQILPPDPDLWQRVRQAISEHPPFSLWFRQKPPMARFAYTVAFTTLLFLGVLLGKALALHYHHLPHAAPTVEAGSLEAYDMDEDNRLWEELLWPL